ncbi:tyrosine-type recombinase/integrase [Alkalicoccobacillus porphyridii]|uniref:Tyrosine-type recombinase/integrase n=1 Tax=Alkalicoccobacillus porphyridii TaxID=2597270 RepID=A0A553ZYH6_9BACI|nr:site-specific integrase [Alkalicoccobacillus porphyridii]TSB46489.1 tyrosine-type recombinase/integrase [Alkalicoccobacillus porphyridii]
MTDLYTHPVFVTDFLISLEEKGRASSTIKRYSYDLEDFFKWLMSDQDQDMQTIWTTLTHDQLDTFFLYLMEKRGYKVRTIRRIISVTKQLAKFTISTGMIVRHPATVYEPPKLTVTPLERNEWLSQDEVDQLLSSVRSEKGLSENQLLARPMLTKRNDWILSLFIIYGLTLQEVARITMFDIQFARNQLVVRSTSDSTKTRVIQLEEEDKQKAFAYYQMIPEPVRPKQHSKQPFHVAFDFQRRTFHWSYQQDHPKALTEIAIQKMIRGEVERSGLRKGISAQHLRHTFILKKLCSGTSVDELQQYLGFSSTLSLDRCLLTLDHLNAQERLLLTS